ncbi:MAG: hypothetical protein M3441_12875 [Chloroflexota bacterium]|nr:hypothetical protein [Chloroflexota bacterium]
MPDYTDDISIMEDLDPEPLPQGRGYTREFVLGGLLLLLVVVWAGWQSWQQAAKQQSYRQAEEAVARQDWGLAYDYFRSASDYRDAGARAEQVEKLIQERDRHYRAATTAINRMQWVTALDELHGVRNIQAEYWDVDSLYADVEAQVYSNTLKGAIALRAGAEPPGLYYRTASEWVWLDGSDRWSQVLGATGDSVAYDVPGDNWQPGVTPTPVPFNRQPPPGRPELEGRKLKVATLSGNAVTTRDSTLDPAFYSYYLPSGDRLVAGRHNEKPGSHINEVRVGFVGWWLDYEQMEEGRAVSSTLSLGAPEETVLHFSPESARYLVAVAGGLTVRSSKLELYLGVMGEGGEFTRQPIYSHVGQFGGGQISPDGRYALLTTITPIDDGASEVQTALLFDLVAGTPPYTLTTRTVPVRTVGNFVSFDTWIKGAFLNDGEYAGKLLLVDRDQQQLTLSLIDPSAPGASTVLTRLPANSYLYYIGEKPGGSEVLLNGMAVESDSQSDFRPRATLLFIRLRPGTEPVITYLPQAEGAFPRFSGIYGERLVYELRTTTDVGPGLVVFSVPASNVSQTLEVAPTQIYTATGLPLIEGRGTGYTAQSPSWYPGQDAFAYAQGGSLYVREYDGRTEVKLEASVLQLIDPNAYLNASYFR